VVLFLFLVLGIVAYVVNEWRCRAAKHELERLLTGDTAISIRAMTITRPRDKAQVARLEDPAALDFLGEMFRHSVAHEGELGNGYDVDLELSTTRKISCGVYFPSQADQLTIMLWDDVWIGGDTYAVTLKRPMPEELDKLLARLRPSEIPQANAGKDRPEKATAVRGKANMEDKEPTRHTRNRPGNGAMTSGCESRRGNA
jgi:hypothetical protein